MPSSPESIPTGEVSTRTPRRVATALLTAGCLLHAGHAVAQDWLQWGGPDGDFKVDAGPLADSWPADGPKQLWKRPLGEGYSSILYQGGRLFTMYRDGDDEIVISVDAGTGETRWQQRDRPELWRDMTHHFGRGPNATPLLTGGRLLAIGVSGRMRCLDPDSGELMWRHDLPSNSGRRRRMEEYGYSASPLPYQGKAIVQVGADDHAVAAFDPADGSIVWRSEPGYVSYAQATIAEIAGRDHYVYFSTRGVVALDPATGETLWQSPIEFANGNHLTPAVPCDDRHLWVGSQFDSGGGRLLEITGGGDQLRAEQKWFETRLQASHWTMIRLGDYVYGSIGGNRTSFLAAFRWRTGEIAWRERGFHKAQALWVKGANAESPEGGRLLSLDEDGTLALAKISPEGIDVLATAPVTDSVSWTLPTLVGATVYLRDQKHILALDLGQGSD